MNLALQCYINQRKLWPKVVAALLDKFGIRCSRTIKILSKRPEASKDLFNLQIFCQGESNRAPPFLVDTCSELFYSFFSWSTIAMLKQVAIIRPRVCACAKRSHTSTNASPSSSPSKLAHRCQPHTSSAMCTAARMPTKVVGSPDWYKGLNRPDWEPPGKFPRVESN